MGILDHFTSIDDLLVTLLERVGGVTEEDTHFFSYPNDGSRATITKGTTTLDFMSGTVMTPAGVVSNLGNSLRARGREYCRSLSLQADRDIIIQIGTKSKIPVFAGTWFKVAHLRFIDVKIVAAEDTSVFVIACTNPDSIEMVGEAYPRDTIDVWGQTRPMGNSELSVRVHAPPITFDRRGDVLRWTNFESATPNYMTDDAGAPTHGRTDDTAQTGDFSYKCDVDNGEAVLVKIVTNDFHEGRVGSSTAFSALDSKIRVGNLIFYNKDTKYYTGEIRYNVDTGVLDMLNSGGTYTTIDTVRYGKYIYNFSTFKLVADIETKKYVRAIVFGVEYDLSQHSLKSVGAPSGCYLVSRVTIEGLAAGVNTAYIDNIVLTENEPI